MWTIDQKMMDQAVALWNVMFLSKGMISFKGVWRSREMKFLQTGSRMKATSTCRMRAAVRAMAGSQVGTREKRSVKSAFVSPGEEYALNPYPKAALALFRLSFNW